MNEKRQKAEKMIVDTISILDKTGLNTQKYLEIFKGMSDAKFLEWIKNNEEHLYLEVLPFKNEPSMHDIEEAAKFIDVPLEEKVIIRNDGSDPDNPSVTTFKQPVGYLHIKKLQQVLSKKTNVDISDGKVSKFGSSAEPSKLTLPEISALTSIGGEAVLEELLGYRSDNIGREEFFRSLSLNGQVYLKDMINLPQNRTTLNVVNAYLLAMGISSDLVAPGLLINANQMDLMKKQEMREKKKR